MGPKLAALDSILYNVSAFDLAVAAISTSRLVRELPVAESSENSARFQHKGNKATSWKQEQ
jgi:hypothetical protein